MHKNVKKMISVMATIALTFSSMGTAAMAGAMDPNEQSIVVEEENPNEEFAAQADASGSVSPTYAEVYNTMIALKSTYPEGMTWTNFEPYGSKGSKGDTYWWKGGKVKGASGGVGCAAFVFLLSDAAFGNLPSRTLDRGWFTYNDVKVGDILRVDNSHFVIVLEKSSAGVIIAEANYNKSVHWGRAMSEAEVMNANFLVTRYPEGYKDPSEGNVDELKASGTEGGLNWSLTNGGTLTISGSGAIPSYNINDGQNPSWNEHSASIRSIVIKEGVTGIGDYAFYQSQAMGVYISNTVTSIGQSAFYGAKLVGVTIPGSVQSIGDSAFRSCANLASVSMSEGLKTVGANAFRGCTTLGYIDFPASITSIGAGAFMDCNNVISIRFKPGTAGVTVGDNLFTRCQRLMYVTLPEKIDKISNGMFANCNMLSYLCIPAGVSQIYEVGVVGADSPFQQSAISRIDFCGTQSEWTAKGGGFALSNAGISNRVTVNYGVTFNNPFAADPNDPGDLVGGDPENPTPSVHTHAWATAWTSNGSNHWHECTVANCTVTNNSQKNGYGGHSYGSWVTDRAPTETQVGSRHRDCTVCKYRQTDSIPKRGHEWSKEWSHDAGHHWHECTVADCTATNNSQKGSYGAHEYGDWVEDIPPTETQVGSEHRDCTVCGYRQTDSIPKIGHSWSEEWSNDAEHHWHECTVADCTATDNSQKGSYGEHSYGDWFIDKAATETQVGSKHRDCEDCGYRQTESIPELGHVWSTDWKNDASHHWHECTAAGCTVTDNSQKNGYGAHSYNSWVIDKAATASKAGSRHRDCKVCEYRHTESIKATGDNIKSVKSQMNTQMKKQLNTQLKSQMKPKLKKQLNTKIKSQLKPKLKKQLNANLKTQSKAKLKKQLKAKLKPQLRTNLKKQLKPKLKTQLKASLKKQLKADLKKKFGKQLGGQFNSVFETQYNKQFNSLFETQYNKQFTSLFKTQYNTQFNRMFKQLTDKLILF